MKNLVTVITICFNSENEIERTMRSVLEQSYNSIEYIIIDGCSQDKTCSKAKSVVSQYKSRDVKIFSEPDKGIYDAMNKGIKFATGDWLIFMNSGDCFYNENVLSSLMSDLTQDIDILRGNIIRRYPRFDVKSVGVTSQNPGIIDMINNTFHHQACLIKKKLFEDYGYYSLDYSLCSDWKFFYDCVVLHKVKTKYVDITVSLFSMDGTSSNNALQYRKEQEKYLTQLYGEELYGLLKELQTYRKVRLFTIYYKVRTSFMNSLSPTTFNRLLTVKRFICKLLGQKVN